MTVVEVDRLHARYHGTESGTAARLDEALRVVAGKGLANALVGRAMPTSHAVCVPELNVHVDLDPLRPVDSVSGAWAAAIADALVRRLADGHEVVVYARELDLFVDMVRSLVAGDGTRTWAWQQAGGLDPRVARPRPADLAEVLARRPAVAPSVLMATVDVIDVALQPAGWHIVARTVRGMFGGRTASSKAAAGPGVRVARTPAVLEAVSAARALIPRAAWAAARSDEARADLAVLALACVAPALSRDPVAIEAVADGGASRGRHGLIQERPARDDESAPGGAAADSDEPPEPVEAESTGAGPVSPQRAALSDEVPEPEPEPVPGLGGWAADREEPVVSRVGGVLFLIHGITALDLPMELLNGPLATRTAGDALARVVAAATGAAVDDPATLVVAGVRRGEATERLHDPLGSAQAAAVEDLSHRLTQWVRDRLGSDDEDLAWVWRRRTTIDAEPGWVEATFSLDDVDLRIRAAGLDFDPGVVWWLGGVVRFRYV
ncbi:MULTISPECIES: hypothetical protein [Rhodococcus]|uniref:hypothetical protein n=1 Tax=Rhodococcus TaxID=1827 RepID=UPI00135C85EA|nr:MULTISPECIES: hypothetical protein [Rhodococcus]KAF0956736.1 hypothetical protein MLGJGCBP_10144 [Rhodococcus sp. T7]KAF0966609.1 hypothetical protein MLGJGCBP_00234 [Rhodococcus sp. T7]UOT08372.1 hypothetical protein MPY17_39460 [Rhodococcus opacus]